MNTAQQSFVCYQGRKLVVSLEDMKKHNWTEGQEITFMAKREYYMPKGPRAKPASITVQPAYWNMG